VEQCRKRFGSSVAEQQCKRKKKRNAQKELKRKAKKGKEQLQVHVPTCSEKEPNKEEEERSVIDELSTEEEIEDLHNTIYSCTHYFGFIVITG